MTDQAGLEAVAGYPQDSGASGHGTLHAASPGGAPGITGARGTAGHPAGEPFHGRPVSWVAVSTIMAAFLIGGLGLILGPLWWLFWAAVGLAAAGGLLALATNIFDDWY
jgi:hypothetical protein